MSLSFFRSALLLIVAGSIATAELSAIQPEPFQCDRGFFLVQDVGATLFDGDDFDPICPDLGIEINNVGYRVTDGAIYAVELSPTGNHGLVRLWGDCSIETLGIPEGLPTDQRFDAGELSPDGDTLYVHAGGSGRVYVVDLTGAPAVTGTVDFGATGNVHDWAFDPASDASAPELVGVTTDGRVSRLELASGTRTDSAVAVVPAGVAYGGTRFDDSGNLVAYRNTGEVFVLDAGDVTAPTVVDNTGFGRASNRNDATSCPRLACDRAYVVQEVGARLFQAPSSGFAFGPAPVCSPDADAADGSPAWHRPDSLEAVPADVELNNLCFRKQDRALYALELHSGGNRGLVRVDPDTCLLETLGAVPGLPASERFDAGDCFDDKMLLNVGGIHTKFFVLDFGSWTAEPVTIRKKHPSSNATGLVHDWAYNPADGKLYGGDSTQGQLATLELLHDGSWIGLREDRNLVNSALPAGIAYGGAWFNGAGHLVLLRNHTGEMFEIDADDRRLVGSSFTALDADFNDGASCVSGAAP